ncbi:MAG TPA: hypothetical protein VNT60_02830 [Deinococcales bacterium]|nr:hypothetical protein [Deinococcales bacterium]
MKHSIIRLGRSALVVTLGLSALQAAGAQGTTSTACTATPAAAEGPYYKAGAPERSDLAATTKGGTPFTLSGKVLDTNCKPIANAVVDFWQADASGNYDNAGFALRGKVRTDANGTYRVLTVLPGLYPGRTAHIHVKVTPPGGATLTTQLYIPNTAANAGDRIYDARTLVKDYALSGGKANASFDFVLRR